MSDYEELREEARETIRRQKRGEIPVEFKVECEDFRVPAMPELDFAATYAAFGHVTPDRSGDRITPNGPPDVSVGLLDPDSYNIQLDGTDLPQWLQQHLATEYATEMDDAFLQAIGGQDRLNELAIEKALP
jgi:hypothetical protein